MTTWRTRITTDNTTVRRQLYAGELFLLPASGASQRLVTAVWREVEAALGDGGSSRQAQFRLSGEAFFERVGQLRKRFYTAPEYHQMVADVIASAGFVGEAHALDPIRLRVVSHQGHRNPAAAPMYYGHRDTWYSNPQSMITWWIPLHDVRAEETFEFFPDEFARPLQNDSQVFDFDAWVARDQKQRIGWQDRDTGRTARYPQLGEEPRGRRLPVACQRAQLLLFSAQHLHRTRPNTSGQTRFSIDFRTVHLEDHAEGVQPLNVDNRSTGCSLRQFVRLGSKRRRPPGTAPAGSRDV